MSRDAIAAAVEAAEVIPPAAVRWFGARHDALPPGSRPAPAQAREAIREILTGILYRDFYCRGAAMPSSPRGPSAGTAADRARLVAEVTAANAGTGTVSPGWRVYSASPAGALEVRRGGLGLIARDDQVASGDPVPGALVALRLPPTRTGWSPGFVTCMGERDVEPGEGLVRYYWNVRREGVGGLVRAVTRTLNGEGLAFRMKILADAADRDRRDRAVTYMQAAEAGRAQDLLAGPVHDTVARDLAPGGPAMTLVIARGLATADDPGHGRSFGLHRCSLVAGAVLLAARRGIPGSEAAAEVFRAEGLDVEAPHAGARRAGLAE